VELPRPDPRGGEAIDSKTPGVELVGRRDPTTRLGRKGGEQEQRAIPEELAPAALEVRAGFVLFQNVQCIPPGGCDFENGKPSSAEKKRCKPRWYCEGYLPLEFQTRAISDTIIAIDLGRYKSVACVYTRATRGHTFRTVDTTPDELDLTPDLTSTAS
jgi:hypothetical protein